MISIELQADCQPLLVDTPEQVPADHALVLVGMVGPGAWVWSFGQRLGRLVDTPRVSTDPLWTRGSMAGWSGYATHVYIEGCPP